MVVLSLIDPSNLVYGGRFCIYLPVSVVDRVGDGPATSGFFSWLHPSMEPLIRSGSIYLSRNIPKSSSSMGWYTIQKSTLRSNESLQGKTALIRERTKVVQVNLILAGSSNAALSVRSGSKGVVLIFFCRLALFLALI